MFMKILFAVSEATPFVASGGLADVAGALPRTVGQQGQNCRVVMPLYASVSAQHRERMEFVAELGVTLGWRRQSCTVYRLTEGGIIHYFIDNPYYFGRPRLYGEYDDAERFAFFSKAVLEMLEPVGFIPDVIHCNDWQTALIPIYLNLFYRDSLPLRHVSTLFTIHNIEFQGRFNLDIVEDVFGISIGLSGVVEYDGSCNLLKGAIEQSDLVTTVSPSYAVELMDPWFSFGLDRVLRQNRYKLSGILNGIDRRLYNPSSDPLIYAPYSADDLSGKRICRRELQKAMAIETNSLPIVAMVTRLTHQKGIDLIRYAFDELMQLPLSFLLLGTGERDHECFFVDAQSRYPGKAGIHIGFDASLARRIYAGSDIFLMPSATEPCGLAQMIAMRYGTVPVVRKTGGLKDTVIDADDGGAGYTFLTYNAHDMLRAVNRAVSAYNQTQRWDGLVKRALQFDFGWDTPAKQYIGLYKKIARG